MRVARVVHSRARMPSARNCTDTREWCHDNMHKYRTQQTQSFMLPLRYSHYCLQPKEQKKMRTSEHQTLDDYACANCSDKLVSICAPNTGAIISISLEIHAAPARSPYLNLMSKHKQYAGASSAHVVLRLYSNRSFGYR